jgi:hypothetical protein
MDDPTNVEYSTLTATTSFALMDEPTNVEYSMEPVTIAAV